MKTRIAFLSISILIAVVSLSCRYSARGTLPEHIQTVRIPVFKCNTFYYGLESRLTRALIEKLVRDPRVDVVQNGEDGLIIGEITDVQRRVLRSDKNDRPVSIRVTITVQLSFKDKVEDKLILNKQIIRSSSSSSAAGVYELERGENRSLAEAKAIDELAAEIMRRIVASW